jgi:hypothetical protein
LFRKLAGHGGEVRFRSGDHALMISSDQISLDAKASVIQRPLLPGLTVSVLCRVSRVHNARG